MWNPPTLILLIYYEGGAWLESFVERGQGISRCSTKLLVAFAHYFERVVVETKPNVQPMFFDSLLALGVAAACALSAKTPALLIDRDLVPAAPLGFARQHVCRGNGRHPAAENRDLDFLAGRHLALRL